VNAVGVQLSPTEIGFGAGAPGVDVLAGGLETLTATVPDVPGFAGAETGWLTTGGRWRDSGCCGGVWRRRGGFDRGRRPALLTITSSVYVPGATVIVQAGAAAEIAARIVV
jgi:hypothetical protein